MKLYRIAQNNRLLREGETPLSADKLETQLTNFRRDVKMFFSSKGIDVETKRAGEEVHISIPANFEEKEPKRLLGRYLGEFNIKKMGLAFDVVKE